jgi:death-on-curing family protein
MKNTPNRNLVIYQAPNGAIELKGDIAKETIWANRMQMAEIFGVNPQAVTKHIKNIYSQNELEKLATSSKMELVQNESGRKVKRNVDIYNLDILIAVGYRINSVTGTKFRQWATQTLRKYITDGYAINPSRIERNYNLFLQAVEDVKKLSDSKNIDSNEILELIKVFGNTWFSLDAYDKETLESKTVTKSSIKLDAANLLEDISKLKSELLLKNEATDIFAVERNADALEGIFGNIFQSAFGEEVYPNIESKASHLLYFIVKNHPFVDGNKRSGAFSFIWFLQKSGIQFRHKITPEALTAITLLIATSDPKDKEKIVKLVMVLLGEL